MIKKLASKFLYLYSGILVLLFLYSFTQIDLGLALTRFPALFSIQRAFQHIGYFNRPLSTYLYVGLILLLFASYLFVLYCVKNRLLDRAFVWRLILVTAGILVFSYNAFSHDLFNYIFDAKIFTFYGKNPYEFKALDFPQDPMLGFMHWTHRVYPYGPIWLALTVPLSYLGLHFFLPTFFLFKLLVAASYVGTAYFLEKIVKKIFSGHETFALAFFALNPLIIIESLVSAHNDIVMMVFAMMGLYFLIQKKYLVGIVLFCLSIGIKYATALFLPIFLAIIVMQVLKLKIPWLSFLLTGCACLLLAVLAAAQQSGNFQPWYLLFVLPFAAVIGHTFYVFLPVMVVSLAGLLVYIPFLFTGNWDAPIQAILSKMYLSAVVLSVLLPIFYYFNKAKKPKSR